MRYLSLALAILFAVLFFAVNVHPTQDTALWFLSATIELPVASLATLSYLLGVGTGLFLAVFASSIHSRRVAANQALGSHARSST